MREDIDQRLKRVWEALKRFQWEELELRQNFLAGLATALPALLTLYVLFFVFKALGGTLAQILEHLPGFRVIPYPILLLLSVLFLAVGIYLLGMATRSYMGQKLVELAEALFQRVPVIGSIYRASRQLTDAFLGERASFKSTVLVEFPHPGAFAIGFITSDRHWMIDGKPHVNVFVPTTPNPTSGWYLLIPEDKVQYVGLSVEEGLRLVISGGILDTQKPREVRREGAA